MVTPEEKERHRLRRRNHIYKDLRENKVYHEKEHRDVKQEPKLTIRNYHEFIEEDDYDE